MLLLFSIVFLSSIIIYNLYLYSKRESFIDNKNTNANVKNVILLGDSTIKNNAYVKPTNSIEYLLHIELPNVNIYCLAKDGSNIKSVYKQLAKIPESLNIDKTIIFLSVGGNDLLNKHSNVDTFFQEYTQLISAIQHKLNKCKIVLLNLYIPPDLSKNIVTKIPQWNNKIQLYTEKNNNNIGLIKLDTILNTPEDFVVYYEPSEVGGMKIVKAIRQHV